MNIAHSVHKTLFHMSFSYERRHHHKLATCRRLWGCKHTMQTCNKLTEEFINTLSVWRLCPNTQNACKIVFFSVCRGFIRILQAIIQFGGFSPRLHSMTTTTSELDTHIIIIFKWFGTRYLIVIVVGFFVFGSAVLTPDLLTYSCRALASAKETVSGTNKKAKFLLCCKKFSQRVHVCAYGKKERKSERRA